MGSMGSDERWVCCVGSGLVMGGSVVSSTCALMCACFSEKAEPVASLNANPPNSDLVALAPTPSAPPPTLALVSRQMGDSKPPQAIVKPQILTHIIEGFVIQEGAEPFPVRAGLA